MLRLGKRLACLLLVLAISSLQLSCQPHQVSLTPDVDEVEQPSQSDNREAILSPIEIPYLVANPIEIIYNDQSEGSRDRTLLISGLENRQIDDKINERLKTLYIEMKARDLPPYRGIKVKIPLGSELRDNYLHASVPYSFNNVISVVIENMRYYVTPDKASKYQYGHSVTVTETLNFDLNTGEEIALLDIFADDVNHEAIVNEHVSRLIMNSAASEEESSYGTYWGEPTIKLVSPFKQIQPDQKFYLFQGGINIVFDHNNPELDTSSFRPASLPIYFCDIGKNVAVTQRYWNEDNGIFANNAPPAKEFVEHSNAKKRAVTQQELGDGYARLSYAYPEGLPEQILGLLHQLSQAAMVAAEAMLPDVSEFTYSASANIVGPFINVSAGYHAYVGSRYEGLAQSFCFDSNSKQLSLPELFIDGYDYGRVIIEKLEAALLNDSTQDLSSAQDLYDGLDFTLGVSEVQFCTKQLIMTMWGYDWLRFQVPYKDFGCHNMTIFPE